jgi:hypothetical protein
VPGAREALLRVLEREKPAHTAFTLKAVEPRLVVGLQARLGEDAIVAGAARPLQLGDGESRLDADRALAGSARLQHAVLDDGLRLGIGTRLA